MDPRRLPPLLRAYIITFIFTYAENGTGRDAIRTADNAVRFTKSPLLSLFRESMCMCVCVIRASVVFDSDYYHKIERIPRVIGSENRRASNRSVIRDDNPVSEIVVSRLCVH